MDWNEYKKEIKSLSENEKKCIEILALLEIDYDEEILEKVVGILDK